MNAADTLWVCYQAVELDDAEAAVLSFMSPFDEEEFVQKHRGRFVQARELSTQVRGEARDIYFSIVSSIGTSRTRTGATFRQALSTNQNASRWWYHPTSFRDAESSPVYTWIVALLTIRHLADQLGVKRIVIVGGPAPVAAALRMRFEVKVIAEQRWNRHVILLRGFVSRVNHLFRTLRQLRHVTRPARSLGRFDIMLAGFLDWSFSFSQEEGITDRYFKNLPAELRKRGVSCGWLAWFDADTDPGKPKRSAATVVSQIASDSPIVLLQSFLTAADVFKTIADLRPLIAYFFHSRTRAFRELFIRADLDLRPLFSDDLLRGFASEHIARCEQVSIATERAFRAHEPKFLITFLEHFPHSRAQYEGVRRSGARAATMQHASYCREKTFLHLDPRTEFEGLPDGCAVPHGELVFAMGSFGAELFRECGYPRASVAATGSARYDGLATRPPSRDHDLRSLRILMVSSLDIDAEMQMVEAVVLAAREMPGVDLCIRNHPFRRIETHSRFSRVASNVTITQTSLDEDLQSADLILFTYSTVAEEAFLRGKPVWQWLPTGFNGSALVEVAPIPQFGRISALRTSLEEFRANPAAWFPDPQTQQLVLERLFHEATGSAARIADRITSCL